MENVEKIYEQTRSEIEALKTEQAVRLEKIKTLANELGLVVDTNLTSNVATMKQQVVANKVELEGKLEKTLKELEDGKNA